MKRLFVLGVDGACFDVLDPWVKNGDLPGFAALMDSGCRALLKSTLPPLSPVAWTSMVTGVNPGKHGIYDFLIKKYMGVKTDFKFSFATGRDRKTKAFWEILSEHEKHCIIVNMPCSYPPDPINGKMISGMDAAPDKTKGFYPASLFSEIVDKFGNYYIGPLELVTRRELNQKNETSRRKVQHAFVTMARQRRKIFNYLAKTYPWDVFFGVFTESDMAMHGFFNDISQKNYKEGAIFQVFNEIDLFIRELLQEFGNDIDIMVVSDHGFTSLETAVEINTYLEQQGFLKKRCALKSRLRFLIKRQFNVFHSTVAKLKNKIHMPRGKVPEIALGQIGIDFSKSRIFFNGVYPYFYVLPHIDPESVYSELSRSITSLTYKGLPVFKELVRSIDVFWGPYVDTMPEFIGILNEHFESSRAGRAYMPTGNKNNVFVDHVWKGNHAENGIFIFKGDNLHGKEISKRSIWDIGPTVLAHIGLPVPIEMDGQPIKDVLGNREITYVDYNIYKEPSVTEAGREDAQAIEERLKALGYL